MDFLWRFWWWKRMDVDVTLSILCGLLLWVLKDDLPTSIDEWAECTFDHSKRWSQKRFEFPNWPSNNLQILLVLVILTIVEGLILFSVTKAYSKELILNSIFCQYGIQPCYNQWCLLGFTSIFEFNSLLSIEHTDTQFSKLYSLNVIKLTLNSFPKLHLQIPILIHT